MNSLRTNHQILLRERRSTIHRGLIDKIDREARLIAIKGSRGVGKTNFLLDYCRTYFANDSSALYVNVNNLFFATEGIYRFVERCRAEGIKHLLLDQIHKYPQWAEELRDCYNAFADVQIIFTATTALWETINEKLGDIAAVYSLHGLSFREFLEIETGHSFKCHPFSEIVENHEAIASDIVSKINPLDHFDDYLRYGYYPIYLEEKSHIDYLLKNINLTLEFDIPYINQIELKYLPKLKQLLYTVALETNANVNISQLSTEIGVSRATILNYLYYMRNARMVTLLQDENNDGNNCKKPNKLYIHNPNLLNAVCLDDVNPIVMRKTFCMCQLNPVCHLMSCVKADFYVDEKYNILVRRDSRPRRLPDGVIIMQDQILQGAGNVIPLWLAGFVY